MLVTLALAGCSIHPTPTPPATRQAIAPTRTPVPTNSSEPTATATRVPVRMPTVEPRTTPTARPTETATIAASNTPEPTATFVITPASLPAAVELANRVDGERLMADVAWLADDARQGRMNGTPAEDEAGAWVADRFRELGLEPFAGAGLSGYFLAFPAVAMGRATAVAPGAKLATAEDVMGVLPGTTRAEEYVLVGAHYDHLGVSPEGEVFNGADDNASGTAAVLEAARLLSGYEVRPQRTVVFVAFSAEEVGLRGAAAVCDQLQGAQVAGESRVLNLDVIGPPEGVDQSVHAWYGDDTRAQQSLAEIVAWAGSGLDVAVVPRADDLGTDARAFWACGVPAVSLTTGGERGDHPYLHTPDDDPEHIDVEGYQDAVRVAVAALWLLANPDVE